MLDEGVDVLCALMLRRAFLDFSFHAIFLGLFCFYFCGRPLAGLIQLDPPECNPIASAISGRPYAFRSQPQFARLMGVSCGENHAANNNKQKNNEER